MLDLLNSATSRYQPRYQHETLLGYWEGNLRQGYLTAATTDRFRTADIQIADIYSHEIGLSSTRRSVLSTSRAALRALSSALAINNVT
jgi:hypothetical protein